MRQVSSAASHLSVNMHSVVTGLQQRATWACTADTALREYKAIAKTRLQLCRNDYVYDCARVYATLPAYCTNTCNKSTCKAFTDWHSTCVWSIKMAEHKTNMPIQAKHGMNM